MTGPSNDLVPPLPPGEGTDKGATRLHASGLHVRLGGRDVLSGLDISVNAGETVAISGPSGVGKTTLLLVLARVLTPDSGTVELFGPSLESRTAPQAAPAPGDGAPARPARSGRHGGGIRGRSFLGARSGRRRSSPTDGGTARPGPSMPAVSGDSPPDAGGEAPFDPLSAPDIPAPPARAPRGHEGRQEPSRRPARPGKPRHLRLSRPGGRPDGSLAATGAGGRDKLEEEAKESHTRITRASLLSPAAWLGFVPQTLGLAPWLTAAENVALVMQSHGLPRDVVEQRTTEALDAVGLGSVVDRIVTDLSGGQRQRVAVARALAARPEVIIADEPTGELDAENRSLVLGLLLDAADAGAAVVIATHDPEVTRSCTRSLVLNDGKVTTAR